MIVEVLQPHDRRAFVVPLRLFSGVSGGVVPDKPQLPKVGLGREGKDAELHFEGFGQGKKGRSVGPLPSGGNFGSETTRRLRTPKRVRVAADPLGSLTTQIPLQASARLEIARFRVSTRELSQARGDGRVSTVPSTASFDNSEKGGVRHGRTRLHSFKPFRSRAT